MKSSSTAQLGGARPDGCYRLPFGDEVARGGGPIVLNLAF